MKKLRSGLQRLRSSPLALDNKVVEVTPVSKQGGGRRAFDGGCSFPVSVSQHSSDWQPLKLTANEAFDQARSAIDPHV